MVQSGLGSEAGASPAWVNPREEGRHPEDAPPTHTHDTEHQYHTEADMHQTSVRVRIRVRIGVRVRVGVRVGVRVEVGLGLGSAELS